MTEKFQIRITLVKIRESDGEDVGVEAATSYCLAEADDGSLAHFLYRVALGGAHTGLEKAGYRKEVKKEK